MRPHDNLTLGEELRRKRKALGLNQQAVAERVGVNQSTIAKWENGVLVPHRTHVGEIARFLEKDPSEIFEMLVPASEDERVRELEPDQECEQRVRLSAQHFYALHALAAAHGTTVDAQFERAINVYLRGLR